MARKLAGQNKKTLKNDLTRKVQNSKIKKEKDIRHSLATSLTSSFVFQFQDYYNKEKINSQHG